jgi:hypothetical protein
MKAHAKAGYRSASEYEHHCNLVLDTLRELEDHFGLAVDEIKFIPHSQSSTAYYKDRLLCFAGKGMKYMTDNGYFEYATLQYLIGIKHKRGVYPSLEARKDMAGDPAIIGMTCHEYAHLITYREYGYEKGRGHGVFFQQIVAECYDLMFGEDFGACDRFLERHGDKWLEAVKQHELKKRWRRGEI